MEALKAGDGAVAVSLADAHQVDDDVQHCGGAHDHHLRGAGRHAKAGHAGLAVRLNTASLASSSPKPLRLMPWQPASAIQAVERPLRAMVVPSITTSKPTHFGDRVCALLHIDPHEIHAGIVESLDHFAACGFIDIGHRDPRGIRELHEVENRFTADAAGAAKAENFHGKAFLLRNQSQCTASLLFERNSSQASRFGLLSREGLPSHFTPSIMNPPAGALHVWSVLRGIFLGGDRGAGERVGKCLKKSLKRKFCRCGFTEDSHSSYEAVTTRAVR